MEIGTVFYPRERGEWREWLRVHGETERELWVRRFKKDADQPCISYDDLVEECLCFGWIDGLTKRLDESSNVIRTTPRKPRSFLSELNRQRVWKLRVDGLMTTIGEAAIAGKVGEIDDPFETPDWIREALEADPQVGETFDSFPLHYRRLKIGWITEAGQLRRTEMEKRLAYLIKNTRAGKMYGTIPLAGTGIGE